MTTRDELLILKGRTLANMLLDDEIKKIMLKALDLKIKEAELKDVLRHTRKPNN